MSRPVERLWDNAVEVTAALVTGAWMLAMFTGQSWWLYALLLGYVVVVPVVTFLTDDPDEEADEAAESGSDRSAAESTDEALGTLRERYARGELTEEQFERKLERILAVETVEDARERYAPDRSGRRSGDGRRPVDERTVEPREREAETE